MGGELLPFRYTIHKERRLVVTTGWDRVTYADVKTHQDQLTSDPDFNPEFDQFIDMRGVTGLDLSIDEAKMAAGRKIFSPDSRRAFLASSAAVFGMGRLLEAYHEMSQSPTHASVFYDLAEALQWLGLESMP